MLRDDPRGNVGGISTSQFISLFILILGVAMVVLCGKKGKADPAAGEAKDEA
jgi:phosphatidylglycerol:prolipoprotein diacylglycerol transferase